MPLNSLNAMFTSHEKNNPPSLCPVQPTTSRTSEIVDVVDAHNLSTEIVPLFSCFPWRKELFLGYHIISRDVYSWCRLWNNTVFTMIHPIRKFWPCWDSYPNPNLHFQWDCDRRSLWFIQIHGKHENQLAQISGHWKTQWFSIKLMQLF
jgi:hypothetical protein